MPPELLIAGVSLTVIVPAIVQGAKALGMPTRYAGLASIVACGVVVGLVELQKEPTFARVATWALLSIVYGLAAAGLYSQVSYGLSASRKT
jgi:hypothetical protein